MRRILIVLLAMLLLSGVAIPAAGAAEWTTEQKFESLKQKGIFAGFSDGSAGLYQSMTREQFAQVLYKLMELSTPTGAPSYSDVTMNRWSYVPVEAVSEAGLMVGTGKRKFSPDSPVTVEQLAAVLVRTSGWAGASVYVVGNVSAWARGAVGIALQNKLIPQMQDYTVTATRGLLVDAVYAVYDRMHGGQLVVRSVVPTGNQVLQVYLAQPVASAEPSRFKLRDSWGAEVSVLSTVVNWDGLSVTVVTARQVGNRTYGLYVDGVPWTYVAISDDTVKPDVSSFARQPNNVLEVTFSEPVDRSTATNASNYSVNNGLKITGIQLSDDGRKVTIYTGWQNEGTTYKLSVKNVKDLAGNTMEAWSGTFSADNAVPVASFQFNESTARITVNFNEKVNPDIAVNTGRYSIDKGVAVTRAELDGDGKTVYLTTTQQKDATLYTLTVSGIPDLAGNTMQTQSYQFGGVANPSQPVQLQSMFAQNDNTLEIAFNRPLSDDDVLKLNVAILTENGKDVSMSGWQSYTARKPGGDNATVVVQFRTANDGDPSLFKPGRVYSARVSGMANLVTYNNSHIQKFAGTEAGNLAPYVKEVVPLSAGSVKILFSEPVKNVSEAAFAVREKDGDAVKIGDDELNNTKAVVMEVVLKFGENLQPGHLYVMSFRSGTITDAAGWNGIQTRNGSEDFTVSFRGV